MPEGGAAGQVGGLEAVPADHLAHQVKKIANIKSITIKKQPLSLI